MTIKVFRNLHPPVFADVDYKLEINNTHPVTSLVFDSLATDNDDHVCQFLLTMEELFCDSCLERNGRFCNVFLCCWVFPKTVYLCTVLMVELLFSVVL